MAKVKTDSKLQLLYAQLDGIRATIQRERYPEIGKPNRERLHSLDVDKSKVWDKIRRRKSELKGDYAELEKGKRASRWDR